MSVDRCELKVLLRDKWRHRIVPRDDRAEWVVRRQSVEFTGPMYAALVDRRGGLGSLAAVALAALHSTLDAYGDGNRTLVAYFDSLPVQKLADPTAALDGSTRAVTHSLLPVIVDHAEQAALPCGEVVQRLQHAVSAWSSYTDPAELLGQGFFDVALIQCDVPPDAVNLPPIPLVLAVHDNVKAARLTWTLAFAEELFDDSVITGVLSVLREVCAQFVRYPDRLVRDLELLPAEQRRQLRRWNLTEGPFAEDKRLNELFEESVHRSPEREAVVFGDRRMTYLELDERSNQLAHWLIGPAVGVRPRDLVALCIDKSDLGVVATFGIWKAGAAYVPVDPTYPADRIRFTIDDTRPTAIITNACHLNRIRELIAGEHPDERITVLDLDALFAAGGAAADQPRYKPTIEASSADLAYVTYTSGTTGVPKGVPKEHRSVINSITDLSQRYGMRHAGTERVALFASYVFEPHLRQTLIALVNSQTLVVVPDDVRLDPDLFPRYLARHGVTYLNATGSVLQHFDLRRCPSLTRLLLVGEELTGAGLTRLRQHFNGRIINEYAFTESAFVTAVKEFPPGVTDRTDRSIGRPLRNVTWYVLSQNRKELPVGAIGELYIGGCGVAPGYLNRPELTARAFFANPFQSDDERNSGYNARIYRTGDLARILPTGEVEYLGRTDTQLKINGVRIEPGEIEARAAEYRGVRRCVVIARDAAHRAGQRHLVGYYLTEDGATVTESELLAYLRARLLPVMVPARMIRLASFPVNVNGKVDWRALPEVDLFDAEAGAAVDPVPSATNRVAVEASLHAELREIWSAVLGVPANRIGAGDDFFRRGGQSISCILLIASIRRRLRREITVRDVFRLRTFQSLADHLVAQEELTGLPDSDELPTEGDARGMLANGLQQSLLYHALRSDDGDAAYVVQSVYEYHSRIRPELMADAWRHAQRRYPSLRLRFEPGVASRQIVVEDAALDWRYVDLGGEAGTPEQEASIEAVKERDWAERYHPTDGDLFRVYLIRRSDDRFTLVFSCHHLIIDGWSLQVLHDEVHRIYLELVEGRTVDPGVDHAYVATQRYWQEHRNDHLAYWTEQIDRIDERIDLGGLMHPSIRYKVALHDYDQVREHRCRRLCLGPDLTARLAAACRTEEVTMHSIVQFAWHRALHAFGGGRRTVVGTIVSGRNIPVDGIESSVGLFINTLPLIVDHADQAPCSVLQAVTEIQSAVNTMNDKSVVELGRLRIGSMKRQLLDTLLVLENYPRLLPQAQEQRYRDALRYEKFFDADRVDHPMALVAREEGDELTLTVWFAGELFAEAAIDSLLQTTRVLLEQVAVDMDRSVGGLDLVSPAMVETLDSWNRTEHDYPTDKTLQAVFEEAAAAWPEATAVVYNDTVLTYRELNERANQLAHRLLRQAELRADDLIALVVEKTELMIVAIIAVWKTGAAYVPIDPEYPDERIAFMLADTDCRLVLANRHLADRLRGLATEVGRPVLALEDLGLDDEPVDNPVTATRSTDLAYAIYTSGTTGRPKAVLVEHRGVVNLQASMAQLFELDKHKHDEAILSFSNYVFDHFVEQLTDAILNGQKLVVLDDRMRTDEARLCRYLNDHQVTYLSGTPSVLSLYDFSSATLLRRIDAIGEDFTEPVFDKIRRTFAGVVVNGYGPTEISITSHKRVYQPGERRTDKSIGLPVANTTCYVLNSTMKRVPIGGVGELYIGGDGVARGYLNRPDLTAERFLDNPFRSRHEECGGRNARLYKTGDLARWLPNGELEYLGRTDLQVKIRGQRVELGEIEAVLAACPGVTRAVVVARAHAAATASAATASVAAQKYLVGFYIGDPELTEQEVLRWMRGKLAEAVIPARVLRVAEIPVTASGKLDVKRLPETEFAQAASIPYAPPTSDVEIRVCRSWADVLGVEPDRIGVQDDFFAFGGDSIRAMALAQALTSRFGRDVGVAAVFRNTTIAAQARYVEEAAVDAGVATALVDLQVGDPPVSLAQERLLFIDEFEGGTSAYNVPFSLDLAGAAPDRVADALRTLVRRHAALRTLLRADASGVRRQRILDPDAAVVGFDASVRSVDSVVELDEALSTAERYVFSLDSELPVRASLFSVRTRPGTLLLSLVFHHTCIDGWSWAILRRELFELLDGSGAGLPAVRNSYADFAIWQRQALAGRALAELRDWWTRKLGGIEAIRLPLDRPRPTRFDYRGREVPFRLDEPTTAALRSLARSARVSLYSVLLSAWCVTLRGFTGQDDMVVGTPFADRGRPEFAGVVGLLANLLAVRVRVDQKATVLDLIRTVAAEVIAAQIHADLPFEQLVKELGVVADPSRHPVVQVNFTLLPGEDGDEPGAEVWSSRRPAGNGPTSVKFDLSTILYESRDTVAGTVTYAVSLFEASSIENFLGTYRHVLRQFAGLTADSRTRVADLTWMDTAIAHSVPGRRSGPVGGPSAGSVHEVFEQQVAKRPDEVAIVGGDRCLTYRELNERANRLAHHLRTVVALDTGDVVALVLDKSELTLVAVLAVWKAGAGYLPIDPSYPGERISFMLDDAQPRLVLTNAAHAARMRRLAGGTRTVLDIDRPLPPECSGDNLALQVTPSDPAYAIYTSGTTGRPKAVLVQHRNLLSFHDSLQGRYFDRDAGPRQGVAFLSNQVFDFSIEQIALSVLSGHRLIIPRAPSDSDYYDFANRAGLTFLSGTPTQIQQLDLSRFTRLRYVLVAGEAFAAHHFDKIRREFAGMLFNAYGTTETTVYNTVRVFRPGEPYRDDLGAPLPNTRLYVLDDVLRPLPPGAPGELYIAGECVAAGYLNRPELTAERFVANHLLTDVERRDGRFGVLYRTGDVVRFGSDAELRYLGRNDAQVKIHGLRIELGEVEAAIATCHGVRECAVVVTEDPRSAAKKRLVGYYVPKPGSSVDDDAVVAALQNRLARHMVPSVLVRLDGPLPTTITGKLDVNSLPAVEFRASGTAYAAPRTRVEAQLCRLWRDLLPVDRVGIDEDFFRTGGDSISALHLASRIQRDTGRTVSVKDIFDYPSVRKFADNVFSSEQPAGADCPGLADPDVPTSGSDCPMLPIQRWFFAKRLATPARYNQTFAIRTPPLDVAKLHAAFDRLVAQHDAFRLRYRIRGRHGGESSQFYAPEPAPVALHTLNVDGLSDEEIGDQLTRWQSGFDLETGPLSCAAYLEGFADGTSRIWIAAHHLVIDVVSWHILAQDLEILYHGGQLGPKGSSFRQWVLAALGYTPFGGEIQLWAQTAAEVAAELRQPWPAEVAATVPHRVVFSLSDRETRALLVESNWAYHTEINDLLLTAVGYALHAVTGRQRNHVTVEGHGRELFDGAPDVRTTMGWFTTMHPVAVEAHAELGRSITVARTNRRRVPLHGIGYGLLRGTYGSSAAPVSPVSFNYLGRFTNRHGDVASAWRHGTEMWAPARVGGEDGDGSAVDITMSCIDDCLITTIDSRWQETVTQRFTAELTSRLAELVALAQKVKRSVAGDHPRFDLQPEFVPYLQVNEHAGGRTLFVLPPGEGGAESYLNNLTKRLPNHRLVLFNNLHLDTPQESFEALGEYYLGHIRRLQPSGPYSLLGWSFGGVLAFELARQLAVQDERIDHLLLIDPYFNVPHALAQIGLRGVENLLDPLNYRYAPSSAEVDRLSAAVGELVLFKADEPNEIIASDDQRRLFEAYRESGFNYLDTLVPGGSIRLIRLPGRTHHDWVQDPHTVAYMGQTIAELLGDPSLPSPPAWRSYEPAR